MKKLTLLFFSLLLFSFALTPTHSQESAPVDQVTQAENDYRYQFDLYRDAYNSYTLTKSSWESSGSLKAEQEAIEAAKKAATARDDVMISYTRWLRVQLLEFTSTYEKAINLANRLEELNQWYEQHKVNIQTASSVDAFDLVMAEYSDPLTALNRETLYSATQTELKIAKIAYFQHQSRALYDPVLKILETKTDIPEVKQGLEHIDEVGTKINDELTSISSFGGTLEAESFNSRQYFRKVNERLSIVQTDQITLLNLMIELESRYARD